MPRTPQLRTTASLFRPAALALSVFLWATAPAAALPAWDLEGWLTRLHGALSALWAQNGCGLDPNGLCGNVAAPVPRDNGCGLDPSGHCGEAFLAAPNGCGLDPDGHCGTAPVTRPNGCSLDPSGTCGP
ncbi:MAG TPA: hypothetical protein VN851_17415 [Thermoanaerobaculia bacterium]|nr:hypothetical protein [Thermoanaerobaculia bacterium]